MSYHKLHFWGITEGKVGTEQKYKEKIFLETFLWSLSYPKYTAVKTCFKPGEQSGHGTKETPGPQEVWEPGEWKASRLATSMHGGYADQEVGDGMKH